MTVSVALGDGSTVDAVVAYFHRRGGLLSTTARVARPIRAADRVSCVPNLSTCGVEAIRDLLGPGTGMLGGAGPKASERDEDGFVIAKFHTATTRST